MKLSLFSTSPKTILLNLFMSVFISIILLGCGGTETTGYFDSGDGSVALSWQGPATNEDGTPLTDLSGYRVYYGEMSGNYTNVVSVGNSSSCSIGSLPLGKTIYLAVTAFDSYGNESSFSNEVNFVLSGS